ncbi:hypothetical protein ACFV3E_36445 [Streptomyces sp. NPDC059718]
MRAFSVKAVAVTTLAATALATGAATASAAEHDRDHVSGTSQRGKGVAVSLADHRGGSLAVSVDATGARAATHTWTLYVDGRKVAAKSYKDRDRTRTWVLNHVPAGDVRLVAPAAAGRITTVAVGLRGQGRR